MSDTKGLLINLEAEQAVLSCIIGSAEAAEAAAERIKGTDFSHTGHGAIFETVQTMRSRHEAVDLLTLRDELQRKGLLDAVGGIAGLSVVHSAAPSWSSVGSYVSIVQRLACRRRLRDAANQIHALAEDDAEPIEVIKDRAEAAVNTATEGLEETSTTLRTAGVVVESVFAEMERRALGGSRITGLTTGFDEIDYTLCGLQRQELIIVAARTSVGKSAFGMQVATHVAGTYGPVVAFALEMSAEAVMSRIVAWRAEIESQTLSSGLLSPEQQRRATLARKYAHSLPLLIDDSTTTNTPRMRRILRKVRRERGSVSMLLVDHIGLVPAVGKHSNRYLELGEISRDLQRIAKEFNIPVVALAQLHRDADGNKPQLKHLRESGDLEQNARTVLFLHRPKYSDDPSEEIPTEEPAEIIVAKQQSGPRNISIPLLYKPPYVCFASKEKQLPATDYDDDDPYA